MALPGGLDCPRRRRLRDDPAHRAPVARPRALPLHAHVRGARPVGAAACSRDRPDTRGTAQRREALDPPRADHVPAGRDLKAPPRHLLRLLLCGKTRDALAVHAARRQPPHARPAPDRADRGGLGGVDHGHLVRARHRLLVVVVRDVHRHVVGGHGALDLRRGRDGRLCGRHFPRRAPAVCQDPDRPARRRLDQPLGPLHRPDGRLRVPECPRRARPRPGRPDGLRARPRHALQHPGRLQRLHLRRHR